MDNDKHTPSPSDAKAASDVGFEGLITLFEQTHSSLQHQAVQAVDIALVARNWLFGWYIVEFEQGDAERSELYGKKLIDSLAKQLKQRGIKGVSATNLRKFREFYLAYAKIQQAVPVESNTLALPALLEPNKLQALTAQLSQRFTLGWTHYVTLLTVKSVDERRFYELEAGSNGWGYRELERQINTALYERLAISRDKAAVRQLALDGQRVDSPADIIKSPYILEFTDLDQKTAYSEHDLESALINKIEHFLLELGKGFLFEARQKRFSFDNRHFFVDLVFYNRLLRSYVIIDLKIGDLKHQDIGQMQMYVNYFDRHEKTEDENPTVGILLCLTKSDELVELTLPKDSNIYASEYQLYLPSKEELKKQLEEVHKSWEAKT